MRSPRNPYVVEVRPRLPRRLARLMELADNLWYAWDEQALMLFARLHPELWEAVNHSPKAFLNQIDEKRLWDAAEDHVFLGSYNRVISAFDTYLCEPLRWDVTLKLKTGDLIAYFCAEFGLHESFPMYSGGLGILAGDHCKSASDIRLPFVAMGLLYRQGYFSQRIDKDGNQIATYIDSNFDDLPIRPAMEESGSEIQIQFDLPGHKMAAKVWEAQIGHVRLYLLDTDLPDNSPEDRSITKQMYCGDKHTRILQDIVLGIGGIRALEALGIKPTVYHLNETHAAFLVLERIRRTVKNGVSFRAALEAVAASTVFTTHTSVADGHEYFPEEMIWKYFSHYCDDLNISREELMHLGGAGPGNDFNVTELALNGSRQHNGVSRIHGSVSAHILAHMWPQIDESESPMDFITSGVHIFSFLAQEWQDLFDISLRHEWRRRISDMDFWTMVESIPDHQFWSVHQGVKAKMLESVRYRITRQHLRNHGSEAHLERMLKFANPLNPNVLTIGFGRRFTTHKRATLLFENMDWLRYILAEEARPVVFIFAGKARPDDQSGRELIRRIDEISRMPEFEGKLLLIEDYDMALARDLVSGCDVWLNTTIYPHETTGTSGIKAAMNGVLNLSVTNGWWDEGYDGSNGWAIKPAPEYYDDVRRNREDSQTLYELLQDQVAPLYYQRNELGYSTAWVRMAKRSIATILPVFNSTRMLKEYSNKYYAPASCQWHRYTQDGYAAAKAVAEWKANIPQAWAGVGLRRLDAPNRLLVSGESMEIRVAANLNGLTPETVRVELLVEDSERGRSRKKNVLAMEHAGWEGPECVYRLELTPERCGRLLYSVRMYPYHELLTHPFEMGLMVWL